MIEDIEKCLNTKLKQEIYCPIDDKIEIEIIKICNNLKKSDFINSVRRYYATFS